MDIRTISRQKKGGCGYIMASFDTHIKCDHCHDKGSRNNHCVLGTENCHVYRLLTPGQHQKLLMDRGKGVLFVLRTLNVILALNVHVLIDANFMFVMTPAPFVF